MNLQQMKAAIAQIPGSNGWWRTENGKTYMRIGVAMRRSGIPNEDVVEMLQQAYSAAADEFGA